MIKNNNDNKMGTAQKFVECYRVPDIILDAGDASGKDPVLRDPMLQWVRERYLK